MQSMCSNSITPHRSKVTSCIKEEESFKEKEKDEDKRVHEVGGMCSSGNNEVQ